MINSQAISMTLEAKCIVCSCYHGDKPINVTVVNSNLDLKFCCHGGSISVGLNMPFVLGTEAGKIRVGNYSAHQIQHLSNMS